MTENNSTKAKVSFFYDKEQITNDRNHRQTIGIGDACKEKSYICGMCYDIDNKMVDAHISYNGSMKFGRHHNCKKIQYCSQISNELKKKESEYIKNIDIDKLKNIIEFNLLNNSDSLKDKLFYFYKANCCLLNPLKSNKKTKGAEFPKKCKIQATTDYVMFIEPTKKVMFYFNDKIDVSEYNDALLLYVNKQGFLRVMLGFGDKYVVNCVYSEYNKCNICNECLNYSEHFLKHTSKYIPTQYKSIDKIIPTKSKYIQSLIETNSYLIDYKSILKMIDVLKKYNLHIDADKIHKITFLDFKHAYKTNNQDIICKVIDNLYHLVYNYTFTYGLSRDDTYDFITDLFIYVMKKETNTDIDFNGIVSKTLNVYLITPRRFRDESKAKKDHQSIIRFYEEYFNPIITDYFNKVLIETHNLESNKFYMMNQLKKTIKRVDNKIDYTFNEREITNFSNKPMYKDLQDKAYRCKDDNLYLKFEKLKFVLLLHFTRDSEQKNTLNYTYFTQKQTQFLLENQSLFNIKHDEMQNIIETTIDEAYKIFNLSNDYNVIKNMRSNYKYPYYTFNYSIDENLRYVIGCNVHLYKGRDEMMSPSYFITNYLKNKLEQPNRYT